MPIARYLTTLFPALPRSQVAGSERNRQHSSQPSFLICCIAASAYLSPPVKPVPTINIIRSSKAVSYSQFPRICRQEGRTPPEALQEPSTSTAAAPSWRECSKRRHTYNDDGQRRRCVGTASGRPFRTGIPIPNRGRMGRAIPQIGYCARRASTCGLRWTKRRTKYRKFYKLSVQIFVVASLYPP